MLASDDRNHLECGDGIVTLILNFIMALSLPKSAHCPKASVPNNWSSTFPRIHSSVTPLPDSVAILGIETLKDLDGFYTHTYFCTCSQADLKAGANHAPSWTVGY